MADETDNKGKCGNTEITEVVTSCNKADEIIKPLPNTARTIF